MGSCVTVEESTIVPLEYWGKFDRMALPGCHCVSCGVSKGPLLNLKIQQTPIHVKTRTKDNEPNVVRSVVIDPAEVKVLQAGTKSTNVAVSSSSDKNKRSGGGSSSSSSVSEDEFELQRTDISSSLSKDRLLYQAAYSSVEEYFRIVVNKHKMDALFDLGTSLSVDCCRIINRSINEYGYGVRKIVIKDMEPDRSIRDAMNNIVASEKERTASITRAEANKTARIKAAEAQAEVARLQGEGIAKERHAICEGLKDTVDDFIDATGADAPSVMSLLMMTQHTDMVKESLSKANSVTMMLKATPVSAVCLEKDIRHSLSETGAFDTKKRSGKGKEKGKEKEVKEEKGNKDKTA